MAQRGYAQLDYQAHLDPWLPGMIATQYPKAIKTGLFQATGNKETAVIKFGLGCGRDEAGSVATGTPSNFGEVSGRPVPGSSAGEGGSYNESNAHYLAGGGAIVTEKIERHMIHVGKVSSAPDSATDKDIVLKGISAGSTEYRAIVVGDYLLFKNGSTERKEILQVGGIDNLTANTITFSVIRGAYESNIYPSAAGAKIAADDDVFIIGRDHNFAGVCIKDITIDGRWTQDSGDAFMHGDEIPVGVEGDFAVRVCGADGDTKATINADELVSVYIGDTEEYDKDNMRYPRIHGSFSNAPASKDYIVLRHARWTTGNREVNTYPATFPPGASGLDSSTKVDVAVARFAANT